MCFQVSQNKGFLVTEEHNEEESWLIPNKKNYRPGTANNIDINKDE
jgi:hypothetical protein